MALNNLGLGIVFTARDLASGVMGRVVNKFRQVDAASTAGRDALGRFTKGVSTLTPALASLAIGLGAVSVGLVGLKTAFALAEPAGKFEQGLAAVGAVTRATTEQMMQLEQAAIQAGVATQFSPQEAVEGLTSLATAGQTATEATSTLIPVLDLAAGSMGKLGVAGAADAVVGTLNSYQLAATEATGVTDKLLRITQLTNFQANDFAVGLSKAAAAGSQFGQSLDDVLITVGLLRNANIDASSSATAFREATRRVATDQRVQNRLLEAGVKVVDEQTGKLRPLINVMQDLVKATANRTEAERAMLAGQIFGARGILAFNAVAKAQAKVMRDGRLVTLTGADAIDELRKKMSRAGGTAAEFRDKLLDTFEGQKTLLQGTLQTIAVAVGKPFAQTLKPLVKGVVDILNSMLKAFLAIPEPIKKFIASAAVIGSFAAAVVGVVIAGKGLVALLGVIGVAIGPVLVIFAKVAAVVAAVSAAMFVLKKAWEANFLGIRDITMRVVTPAMMAIKALFALFTKGEISGALAKDLLKAENTSILNFVKVMFKLGSFIRAFFVGVFDGVKDIFRFLDTEFRPVLTSLFDSLFDLGREVFNAFLEISDALGIGTRSSKIQIKTIGDLGKAFVIAAKGPLKVFAESLKIILKITTAIIRATGKMIEVLRKASGIFVSKTTLTPVSTQRQLDQMVKLIAKRDAVRRAKGLPPLLPKGVTPLEAAIATTLGEKIPGGPLSEEEKQEVAPTKSVPVIGPAARLLVPSGATSISDAFSLASMVANLMGSNRNEGPREIRGTVLLDGKEVGELREQEEMDDRARRGQPRSVMGN